MSANPTIRVDNCNLALDRPGIVAARFVPRQQSRHVRILSLTTLMLTLAIVIFSPALLAFTPMPAELPDYYLNHELQPRSGGALRVAPGLRYEEPTHTTTVSSTGNFIVIEVDSALHRTLREAGSNTNNILKAIRSVSTAALSHFDDQFDFVVLTHNASRSLPDATYLGIHFRASNTVSGIGRPLTSQAGTFGSAGNLQSVIHLPVRSGLRGGPSLHEFMHRWGNSLQSLRGDREGHWGFSSVNGVLGGFDVDRLVQPQDGGNTYAAFGGGPDTSRNGFREDGYASNKLKYSQLELYLMGARSSRTVKPITQVLNAERVTGSASEFTGTGIRQLTIDDITTTDHDRVPDYTTSQRRFRVLYVVVTDAPLPTDDWDKHDYEVEQFSTAGVDDNDVLFNFWEATDGWGSMKFDGLSEISHSSVALPSDYTDIKLTAFEQKRGNVDIRDENNFWLNATISQTGANAVQVDGMRLGLRGLTPGSSEFVRCGSNWAPFEFGAGFVIETGRVLCTIEEAGTYQAELQVRVNFEWTAVSVEDEITVSPAAVAGFEDIKVTLFGSGEEGTDSVNLADHRFWVRTKFDNLNDDQSNLTIDGVETVLESLNGQTTAQVCGRGPAAVIEPGSTYDTGRVYCTPTEYGNYQIAAYVEINGVKSELRRTSTIDVSPPPPAAAADIVATITPLHEIDAVVAGQVDNLRLNMKFRNGAQTAAVLENISVTVVTADQTPTEVCFERESPLQVEPGSTFRTGDVTCPTLTEVGEFYVLASWEVNEESAQTVTTVPIVVVEPPRNVIDDIAVAGVQVTDEALQPSSTNNYEARVVIKNNGRRAADVDAWRFRLIGSHDDGASTSDRICFESAVSVTIPAGDGYDTGVRQCALSTVGNYTLLVEVKVDDEWYEKYTGSSVDVAFSEPVCSPPQSIKVADSSALQSVLMSTIVSRARRVDDAKEVTVTVSGRKVRRRDNLKVAMNNYWTGINVVEVSDDADVNVVSKKVTGNTIAGGVAETNVIPALGSAGWMVTFCNPGWVEVELDFTVRAINLNLAAGILAAMPSIGKIRHNDITELSLNLSEINDFKILSKYFGLAVTEARNGKAATAKRRLRTALKRLKKIAASARARRQVYDAFRASGIKLGRPARGENPYRAYLRQLKERNRSGALEDAINDSYQNLVQLLTSATTVRESRDGFRFRVVGQ